MNFINYFSVIVLSSILISVSLTQTNTENFGSCLTPNNVTGQCIYLHLCSSIFELFEINPLPRETENFIIASQCGHHNNTPLVCCSNNKIQPSVAVRSMESARLITEISPNCVTPNGTDGTCVNVYECDSIYQLIQSDNLSVDDEIYISGSQCGYYNNKPMVCCPGRTPVKSGKDLLPIPGICGISPVEEKLYGGNKTMIDEFPWMALLEYTKPNNEKGFHCAGALINERYVVTACHCVGPYIYPSTWQLHSVRLGEWDTSTDTDCEYNEDEEADCAPSPINILIEKIIKHEQYNHDMGNKPNDIALLRLQRKVEFSNFIKPICLPVTEELQSINLDGMILQLAGWGKTEHGNTSDIKLKIAVPVVNLTECNRAYRGSTAQMTSEQICAGGVKDVDSCIGDSGGPLMSLRLTAPFPYWYMVGIVSFGPRYCGLKNVPGVYVRATEYVDWITSHIHE